MIGARRQDVALSDLSVLELEELWQLVNIFSSSSYPGRNFHAPICKMKPLWV